MQARQGRPSFLKKRSKKLLSLRICCCASLCGLLAGAARPYCALGHELLSLRGIQLPAHGYISSFHIDTWGVTVLAVCHLPPGWTVTAGRSADPSGVLGGTASLGVTFLNSASLSEPDDLFLIEVSDYQPAEGGTPNIRSLFIPHRSAARFRSVCMAGHARYPAHAG